MLMRNNGPAVPNTRVTASPYIASGWVPTSVGKAPVPAPAQDVLKLKAKETVEPRVFAGGNFDGQDWSGSILALADFSNMSGQNCNFENADLFGADFTGSTLTNAVFNNCDLRGANFAMADLRGAQFLNADLSPGKIARSDVSGNQFDGFALDSSGSRSWLADGGDGADVKRPVAANFAGARLCDADFSGAKLRKANMAGADLANVLLENCDLCETNFLDCDLATVSTSGSDLSEAICAGGLESLPEWLQMTLDQHLVWIDSNGAMGKRANLTGMDLRRMDLSNCDLRGAVLEGVDATGASFLKASLAFTNFAGATLPPSCRPSSGP